MDAVQVWRHWPAQIASDLSQYHHRRIADWHHGVMCSHELLELCEQMPEDGALKNAIFGRQRDARLTQIANELAVIRAGMVPGIDGEKEWDSTLFLSIERLKELVTVEETRAEGRDSVMAIGVSDDDEAG